MMEFTFEDTLSPWDLALSRLGAGDTLSAQRFLALVRISEDVDLEDAALELEQMGVMLDITDLPKVAGNQATGERLKLERAVVNSGNLENLGERDPLRLFLEELGQGIVGPELDRLAKAAAGGDRKAEQKLVEGCQSLVLGCVEPYLDRGVVMMDLIQEGNMGLWQGLPRYKGGDFAAHAKWWICQAMARTVALQAESDGVGDHLAQAMDRYRRADRALLTALGRAPTEQELAQELGITLEETVALGKTLADVNAKAKADQENTPEAPEEEESQAVEDTAYYQTRERVSDLMEGLTAQETMVLNLRYGLSGKAPMTVRQVADQMGLMASQVSALEKTALEKMRGKG